MKAETILKKIGAGFIISIAFLSIIYICGGFGSVGQIFLQANLPGFNSDPPGDALMKYNSDVSVFDEHNQQDAAAEESLTELVGIGDVVFFDENEAEDTVPAESTGAQAAASENLELLKNLEYLQKNYYIVDKKTGMSSDYFNIDNFMSENLKISKDLTQPRVLVFHTHAHEMFADSNTSDINEGIVGAGTRLCQRLEEKGIKTIHITDSFDYVDGKSQITGAYERMEPKIRQVLNENPSLEVVIDMHRDGVAEGTHLVTTIDGKPTAQIMFFNGLCRLNKDGKLNEIDSLPNPYIPQNLAFSFNLKKNADTLYPSFARKIYLNAYRYSLHMAPLSTLIEVGAQTNTKAEIYNAIDLLSEVIYKTIM